MIYRIVYLINSYFIFIQTLFYRNKNNTQKTYSSKSINIFHNLLLYDITVTKLFSNFYENIKESIQLG